jgi:uncharacterized delta-60 repeat protein
VDASFGEEGIALDPSCCGTFARDVTVLGDGRLLEVGLQASESNPVVGPEPALFTPAGDYLDGGFSASLSRFNSAYRMVVPYPGGGAASSGWAIRCLDDVSRFDCTNWSKSYFMVAKHLSDGSRDPAFDGDGVVITAMGSGDAVAESVAVQPDGKIVVAGSAQDSAGAPLMALARYRVDGSLDPTFGSGGRVLLRGGQAVDVVITPTGKLVVAGTGPSGFVVVRLLPSGARDLTFGQQGRVQTGFENRTAKAADVALASGKIVVGGSVTWQTSQGTVEGFAVMRFTSSGALDATFDTDGKVITTFTEGPAGITELAVTGTGKIVAAGGPGVARYTSTGQRDLSFGGDGRVWLTNPFYGFLNVGGIALQGATVVLAWDNGDFMGLTRLIL